jgi:hypothetical protein
MTGRELWKELYMIRYSVSHDRLQHCRPRPQPHPSSSGGGGGTITSSPCCCSAGVCAYATPVHPLNTIEILPPEEEAEAILYDNHELDDSERQPCVGYFGFQPLERVVNSQAGPSGSISTSTPIAVWGDYPGLRIAPCWDSVVNARSRHRDRLVSVHDEKQSQVMDLIVHPRVDACFAVANGGYTSPFFLAFASGVVMAVAARDDEFKVISTSSIMHSSEVTCLAIIPGSTPSTTIMQNNTNSNNSGFDLETSPGCLVSACVNGHVYLYPHSLTKLDLTRAICLNQPHLPRFPVFSMSATIFAPGQTVLCLGGQGLKLSLWQLAKPADELEVVANHDFEYEPHVVDRDPGDPNNEDDQVDHAITLVSFVGPILSSNLHSLATAKKDLLVVGTSRGHILTWDLVGHTEDPHRPHLKMYTCQERAHCGSIESAERIGNVLFTSGGKDGIIKATDLASGLALSTLLVHPGRLLAPSTPAQPIRLKCAVVQSWICHELQSIVCLCRDGHVNEWSFSLSTLSPSSRPAGMTNSGTSNTNKMKSKRATAGGMPTITKRSRPGWTQDHTIVPPFARVRESTGRGLSLQAHATGDCEHDDSSTIVDSTATLSPLHRADKSNGIEAMLDALPQQTKDLFNHLGFCKWKKYQLPVLILSPLSVPSGAIRDAWCKDTQSFLKRQQRSKSRTLSPPCLVHWIGTEDPRRAYSTVHMSTLTLYDEGVAQSYDKVPQRLQQLVDQGKSLPRIQQEYVNGLALLPREAARKPEQRSHLLEHFTRDDSTRKEGHARQL